MASVPLRHTTVGLCFATWFCAATAIAQPNLAELLEQEANAPVRPVYDEGGAVPRRPDEGFGPRKERTPSNAETRKATAAVQNVFKEEFFRPTSPAKRPALAQQLLAQAERTSQSADRRALYREVVRLAAEAGDAAATFAIIDATTAVYAVDPIAAKLNAIGRPRKALHVQRPAVAPAAEAVGAIMS